MSEMNEINDMNEKNALGFKKIKNESMNDFMD